MAEEMIKIDGLKDFQKALKNAEDGLQKQLRIVFNEAADLVVDGARPDVPVRSGKLRASLRASSQQRSARVTLGRGKTANYAGWIEFGGRVGIRRSVSRRVVKEGRSMYPAMVKRSQTIHEVMAAGLIRLADEAGL